MDIILAKDFPSLGFVGDTVSVKRGFARNFLIPRGVAVEASSRNKNQLKHKVEAILAVKRKLQAEAEKKAEELKNIEVKLVIKVGEGGRSFGSVGTRDIEQALKAQGIEISRKQISLSEAIKSVGEYYVTLKLHSEVQAEVKVNVVADKALVAKTKKKGKAAKAEASDQSESATEVAAEEGAEQAGSTDVETSES